MKSLNSELTKKPELVNQDPYGEGWLCELELAAGVATDNLLDAVAYGDLTAD